MAGTVMVNTVSTTVLYAPMSPNWTTESAVIVSHEDLMLKTHDRRDATRRERNATSVISSSSGTHSSVFWYWFWYWWLRHSSECPHAWPIAHRAGTGTHWWWWWWWWWGGAL